MFRRPKKPSSRARAWLPLAACAALLAACSRSAPPPPDGTHPAACFDGVKSLGESDVDCGGQCAGCADGKACVGNPDCASGVCQSSVCAAPTCTDGVKNGDETGTDCGGTTCPGCGSGMGCLSQSDCAAGVCLEGSCDCGDASGVYVSATTGNDTNAGTSSAPLKTIQAAVACANKVPREIRVAEGVYEASDSSRISLLEGKSLVGGWPTNFVPPRDPAGHVSEIRDTTDTGPPTGTGTGQAVYVSSTSTQTVLDGFTIQATTLGAGISVTALSVVPLPGQLAGATVQNDVIDCGGNPGVLLARCVDLGTSGGSIVLRNNVLHLGTSSGTSWGIQGYGVSSVEISGNVLDGGSSAAVIPIELWVAPGASPVVSANDVRPGAGGVAGVSVQLMDMSTAATPAVRNNVVVVMGTATGIDDGSGAEISNNTVVAGTGTAILTSVPGAAIQNNAIVAQPGGVCVKEASAGADPSFVRNNDPYGCDSLYVDEGNRPLFLLGELNALPGASRNISADPALLTTIYSPLPGSPLLGAGLDLSSLFQTDITGAFRDPPWSIGAYQAP